MPSRIEFSLVGEVPDADSELAHSIIHETSPARKALVKQMEELGMTNVRMDARIVPQRAQRPQKVSAAGGSGGEG